jgi:hypothetical protein
MTKIIISCFLVFFAVSLCPTDALSFSAQREPKSEVFSSVPEPFRASLAERLRALVEYENARQWGSLYDLLYDPEGMSREQFIRQRNKHRLRKGEGLFEFNPQRAYFFEAEQRWIVEGCGRVRGGGHVMNGSAIVRAVLKSGEWYLSRVTFTGPKGDPCAGVSGTQQALAADSVESGCY